MNAREPNTKFGKLDLELNRLSKILFLFMICIALALVALDQFRGLWLIKFFRFILLLCSIIPISLRVNLDMAKVFYAYCIYKDTEIPGTIPRNSTIPEELGRIQYLLTDKTGTLTKNEMTFKKVTMEYAQFDLVRLLLVVHIYRKTYLILSKCLKIIVQSVRDQCLIFQNSPTIQAVQIKRITKQVRLARVESVEIRTSSLGT